ncbi:MAG TPA: hypothetical protein VJ124_07945 [Pyrinomonadaceae bacterium]|nr:hypothetical protein [Pyrinomonadaceae bacterium]
MTKIRKLRPLWRCPKCGERFVTANMWHACGRYSLASLFAKSDPHVIKLFRKFARMVRNCGPVRMIYSADELDAEVQAWLRESYEVGAQTRLLKGDLEN